MIDLIIELKNGKYIVLCCSHDQRTVLPKVVPAYIEATGDKVIGVIKTGWLVNQVSMVSIGERSLPFVVT